MRAFQPASWEILGSDDVLKMGNLIPVYPLTEGLFPRQVRRLVRQALDLALDQMHDFLIPEIKKRARLIDLDDAIRQAHYPADDATRFQARRRLAFD